MPFPFVHSALCCRFMFCSLIRRLKTISLSVSYLLLHFSQVPLCLRDLVYLKTFIDAVVIFAVFGLHTSGLLNYYSSYFCCYRHCEQKLIRNFWFVANGIHTKQRTYYFVHLYCRTTSYTEISAIESKICVEKVNVFKNVMKT